MKGNKCKLCKDKSPGLLMAWNPGKEVVIHTEKRTRKRFHGHQPFETGPSINIGERRKGFKMGLISDCSIVMISFVVLHVFITGVTSLSFNLLSISKRKRKKKKIVKAQYINVGWKLSV